MQDPFPRYELLVPSLIAIDLTDLADYTDGGGIRGMSALLILERLMEEVRDANGFGDIPRPCDYFDLIGGTSTGGQDEPVYLTRQ